MRGEEKAEGGVREKVNVNAVFIVRAVSSAGHRDTTVSQRLSERWRLVRPR